MCVCVCVIQGILEATTKMSYRNHINSMKSKTFISYKIHVLLIVLFFAFNWILHNVCVCLLCASDFYLMRSGYSDNIICTGYHIKFSLCTVTYVLMWYYLNVTMTLEESCISKDDKYVLKHFKHYFKKSQ